MQVRQLQKAINVNLGADIDDDESFDVSDINFLEHTIPGYTGEKWEEDKELIRSVMTTSGSLDNDHLLMLKEKGMIIEIKETSRQHIKLYMAFSSTDRSTVSEYGSQELSRLLSKEELSKSDLELENVSIYSGGGFAEYIVKGLVANYNMIYSLNFHLATRFIEKGFRQMTFLVANVDAYESDQLAISLL